MLIGTVPLWGEILIGIVSTVAALAALVALIAGAIFLVKSRKVATNNELADSAVQSLQAALEGMNARLTLTEMDSKHCHELREKQDLVIKQQTKRIDQLTEDLTQRAAVAEFRDEVRGLLIPMAQKLGIESDEHPPIAASQ